VRHAPKHSCGAYRLHDAPPKCLPGLSPRGGACFQGSHELARAHHPGALNAGHAGRPQGPRGRRCGRSSAWQRLGDLEAQILRERERLALLEAGLAATPEVKALESIEDFKRSDERKGIAAQVESSRSEIDLMTKRHQGQAGRARGLREAPEVMAEIGAAEPLG
jgi:hypothetical protein